MKLRFYLYYLAQFSCGKFICKNSMRNIQAFVGMSSLQIMKQYPQ